MDVDALDGDLRVKRSREFRDAIQLSRHGRSDGREDETSDDGRRRGRRERVVGRALDEVQVPVPLGPQRLPGRRRLLQALLRRILDLGGARVQNGRSTFERLSLLNRSSRGSQEVPPTPLERVVI